MTGKYNDVIAMLPCSNTKVKSNITFGRISCLFCEIGFDPIITMTDANHVNHRFLKSLYVQEQRNFGSIMHCPHVIPKEIYTKEFFLSLIPFIYSNASITIL